MKLRHPALLSALFLCASLLAGEAYETYTNARYNYRIGYPADFLPQAVADAGDGRIFLSPTGDAELRVFASACLDELNATPEQYVAGYKKQQRAGQLSLSYQRAGKDFAVVSGHRKGRIFYGKILIHDDWCTQFTFEYNESQSEKYNAVTNRLALSFKR
jgi:hypothetical protein